MGLPSWVRDYARARALADQRVCIREAGDGDSGVQAKAVAQDARQEARAEGTAGVAFSGKRRRAAAVLAAALLRFQCVFANEGAGKTALHACESGERETGGASRRLAVE